MFFPASTIEPTMSLTQRMIYQGNAFRFFHKFTVPANSDYTLSVSNGDNAVHLFSRLVKASVPDVLYEVRDNAVIASYDSSALDIFNMNGYSSKDSANVARVCTASDIGDLVDMHELGGSTEVGNRKTGDESLDPDDIKILKNNNEFLLRLDNPNNEPAVCFLYLKWFETAPDLSEQ